MIIKVIILRKILGRRFYEGFSGGRAIKTRRSGLCESFIFDRLSEKDSGHNVELVFITWLYIPFFIDGVI